MKKKVFITGISSSIMQKLIQFIDLSEYEIIGLSRKPLEQNSENIKIIQHDITNIDLYAQHLKGCDLIIHAAAVTHSFTKKIYYDINYEISKKLIDKAKEFNVNSFVYISSNTASQENGAYADSKYLAEKYLQKTLSNWQIFRISEIFGGNNKEGIDKLIETACKKNYILCPKSIPNKFSPIHIDDTAKILHKNIFINSGKNKLKCINGKEQFTFIEIISLIRKNKPLKIISIPKNLVFFIMRITRVIPFYIGVIPDQIKRLYGLKSYGITNENDITLKLNDYIESIIKNKYT